MSSTPRGLCGAAACHACTDVGCGNSVSARLELPAPISELKGARVTVCKDDQCIVRAFVPPCIDADGSLAIYCYASAVDQRRNDVIMVSTLVPEAETRDDAQLFTFFVTDASGTVIAQRSGRATFTDRDANGPGCGVTCRVATLP